jgi:hypothetical protein
MFVRCGTLIVEIVVLQMKPRSVYVRVQNWTGEEREDNSYRIISSSITSPGWYCPRVDSDTGVSVRSSLLQNCVVLACSCIQQPYKMLLASNYQVLSYPVQKS